MLESYVAGRVKAERLAIAVAAAYYGGDRGRGTGEGLRPLIDIIDRASPGIVELGTIQGGAGFDIRLVERPFPKQYESELRGAAKAALAAGWGRAAPQPVVGQAVRPGLLSRIVGAVRRLFASGASVSK